MSLFELLVGALKELFAAVPFLNKWFTKTATEKVENKKADIREDADSFKKTGRPQ